MRPPLPAGVPMSRTAPTVVLSRERGAADTAARPGPRPAPTAHATSSTASRTHGVGTVGLLALAAALVPLAGWGAGWPDLASYLRSWQVVAPLTSLLLVVVAIGVTAQGSGLSPAARRVVSAVTGLGVLLAAGLLLALRPDGVPVADAEALVSAWESAPGRLLALRPPDFALGAFAFLGAGLALRAVAGAGAVYGTWLCGGAAALVALLTAGVPMRGVEVELITPPVAVLLLVFASVLLLVRTPHGGWWIAGGAGSRAARALLPGALVVVPTLVWFVELLERNQRITLAASRPLLSTLLVLAFAGVGAVAVWRAGAAEEALRGREERRREREVRDRTRRAAQHAAQQADATVRVAAERYRAQLRTVLELSPVPFVAVDRDGHVVYLNAQGAALFGCSADAAAGRPVWELWPEAGAELRGALGARVGGAPLQRTIVSARTGRAFALSGHPDEAGTALFVREVEAR